MPLQQYGFSPACKTCAHARVCAEIDDDCILTLGEEED